jgi:hippurate hydrolase
MRDQIQQMITVMVANLPLAFGAVGTVEYREGYPVTKNDPACAERVREVATELLGSDSVIWNEEASMASEDFAFMLDSCPGAYFWLGADGQTASKPLHHPSYDFNDNLLPTGVRLFSALLHSHQTKP